MAGNLGLILAIYLKPVLPEMVARIEQILGTGPLSWDDLGRRVEGVDGGDQILRWLLDGCEEGTESDPATAASSRRPGNVSVAQPADAALDLGQAADSLELDDDPEVPGRKGPELEVPVFGGDAPAAAEPTDLDFTQGELGFHGANRSRDHRRVEAE